MFASDAKRILENNLESNETIEGEINGKIIKAKKVIYI